MKTKLSKIYVFLLISVGVVHLVNAQNTELTGSSYKIIRSSLGAGGISKIFSSAKGQYSVSQSIGQSSVIGTSSKNSYYLIQGYQQQITSFKVKKSRNNSINATVYPNPFNDHISVSFDQNMTDTISVSIYDVTGKLVYTKDFLPTRIIQLNIKNFPNGLYMLSAFSNGKLFNAKLVKI